MDEPETVTLSLTSLNQLEERARLVLKQGSCTGHGEPWADHIDAVAIIAIITELRRLRELRTQMWHTIHDLREIGGMAKATLEPLLLWRPDLRR